MPATASTGHDDGATGSDERYAALTIENYDRTNNPLIDRTTDILFQTLLRDDEVVGRADVLLGRIGASLHGTLVHIVFARDVRSLDIPGIGQDGVEQSFSLGGVVRYGLDGSIRTDIVMRDDDGDIIAVWDVKTGNAALTQSRTRGTEDAGGYSGYPMPDDEETDAAQKPVEYAALEPQTRTDATDAPAGVQYASETEDDEGESRAGSLFEGTPAQLLRQKIAEREYQAALSQVLRYDPTWKPSPSLIDPNDIEGDIARLEAWTEEAKKYFGRLRDLIKPLDRNTGNPVPPSTARTGDPLVDSTTEKLNSILDRVVARIGPRSDRTAGQYGKEVHDEFKREVSALGLTGIDHEDLDRTFGVGEAASYGEKDSVRPDVVLRDDQGNIAAIYDVKTGAGFTSFQVIKYRLRTDTDSFVPIFELHPHRRTIWRCQIQFISRSGSRY